jgi:phosphoribosyl 1,2-cyclic phosphodiesterase
MLEAQGTNFASWGGPGFRMTVLASGSSGNCVLVETPEIRLLVDAGLSGRKLAERLALLGLAPELLDGVLLTHEHIDHCVGLKHLMEKLGKPVYGNRQTVGALKPELRDSPCWRFFETGDSLHFGELQVETFQVPHDAYDPVAYVFTWRGVRAGVVTDLGHATALVREKIRHCQALLLEANHDLEMLRADAKRPWPVKQRIMARHGHLSNDAAAELALELAQAGALRHLFLGHLSEDCNHPERAERAVLEKLSALAEGCGVRLYRTYPHRNSETVELAAFTI